MIFSQSAAFRARGFSQKMYLQLFNLKKRDESKIYDILYDKSDKTSDFIKIFCFVVSL